MKNLLLFFIIISIIISCAKEQEPLKISEMNLMVFNLDNGWELNGEANITGFTQNEEEKYKSKLTYFVNLITPQNDTLREIDYGIINKTAEEEILELPINLQIEFDSSFTKGNYNLLLFLNDDLSNRSININKKFLIE